MFLLTLAFSACAYQQPCFLCYQNLAHFHLLSVSNVTACSKSGHCFSPGQPLQLCLICCHYHPRRHVTLSLSFQDLICARFPLSFHTTLVRLLYPVLCQHTEIFPPSGSYDNHPFSWPSISSFWSSDLPPHPASLGQPTACIHCIPGGLPPPWSWALPCPDFAECFLLEQKWYARWDLPTGLCHLIATPTSGSSSGAHCTAVHQAVCSAHGLYSSLQCLKGRHEEEQHFARLLQLWQHA